MKLSPSNRILLNVVASYGRSVFILFCGLFSARWVLMILGEVDYGLLGVVGGLTSFIAFANNLLAVSVGRFYAFSVGQAIKSPESGLKCCQEWFNTALLIHVSIPLLLVISGYPLGEYAIRNWLTIPVDRIEASIWIWRFVVFSSLISMVNVPFMAMYTAKQYIAELTIYGVVSAAINIVVLYLMVTHPGKWLVKYALWTCLLTIIQQIIIGIRAMMIFPECRFQSEYLWSWKRIKELGYFSGWQFFGNLGALIRGQGVAILINKYFGPSINSANAIASNTAAHADMLSSNMLSAFAPAITNACGMGNYILMRRLAYRACKFGVLLTLLLALPLALELSEILKIWLKEPPPYTAELCWGVLLSLVIDKTTAGHMLAVHAKGEIVAYQTVLGTALILTLPIAWVLLQAKLGIYAIVYAMVFTICICAWGRIWFARSLVGMSINFWAKRIMFPIACIIGIACIGGLLPRLWMKASLARICTSAFLSDFLLIACCWFLMFNDSEKQFVFELIHKLKIKFHGIVPKFNN